MDAEQLRSIMKQRRASLSVTQIQQHSEQIANHLLNTQEYQQATHIAYYLPVRGEADPTSLLQAGEDKHFYLPTLKQGDKEGLDFIRVTRDTRFEKNKYGIQEPKLSPKDLIEPAKIDLVITPLVSYDLEGNRMGMGGGFYDRTFAFKQVHGGVKPLLVGYAYAFQQAEELVPEAWDVKLDGVVTEMGYIRLH